ncbi:MAG: efflux RND transporter periplasmic adaptor subunit [Burkholderiaceae bacterium]
MKRWIPWTLAALVAALMAVGVARALAARQAQQQATAQATQREAPALLVQASEWLQAERRILTLEAAVSGTVRAVDTALVKARVAGELQGLTVREGDTVSAGQVLARIDPTESQARLRQATQQADAARAQVDIQQRLYDNNRALMSQGFISSTALATSQANLDAARASYEAAAAAADVARKALQDTQLRSPITGQVSQRFAQPGERLSVDGRVLEVVDLSRLEVEGMVAPGDSVALRVGQTALLQVEGTGLPVQARVVRIGPSAQTGNRNVLVYLRLDAASPGTATLRPGLFLTGRIATGTQEATVLPLDAVRTDQPAPYVQAVRNDRVVHLPVRLGPRSSEGGTTWVAVEGLDAGQRVLAGRLGALREGTRVQVAAAPTAASAASTASSGAVR